MEQIINMLLELRVKECEEFIKNSLIVYNSKEDSPVPDTKSNLERIISLDNAVCILKGGKLNSRESNVVDEILYLIRNIIQERVEVLPPEHTKAFVEILVEGVHHSIFKFNLQTKK